MKAGVAPRGHVEGWALRLAAAPAGLSYGWSSTDAPGAASSRFNAVDRLLAAGLLAQDDRRRCYRAYELVPGRFVPPPPAPPSWPGKKPDKLS